MGDLIQREQAYRGRAGTYRPQPGGYSAFVPEPLPPSPPLRLSPTLVSRLSAADLALGRLDGAALTLPDPDLFVGMYVRQEAVLSSQIEGTQASLTDVLQLELWADGGPPDVREVVNYVDAMNYGLERIVELPLSLRLVREIHSRLMAGVRGGDRQPGEFRTAQNWVGGPGSSLKTATFVPPPPSVLQDALAQLERFWHDRQLPPLIRAGLAHAQFETIHPFRDGNGRVGRLLITFMLCSEGVLRRPLLYLSHYLKKQRPRYYDALQAVRDDGKWEEWLDFFLAGVAEVSEEAASTARSIVALREADFAKVRSEGLAANNLMKLLELLFRQPIVTVPYVQQRLDVRYQTANELVERLVVKEILTETTGRRRNRRFAYKNYLDLFPS
jgi:Fic family protein